MLTDWRAFVRTHRPALQDAVIIGASLMIVFVAAWFANPPLLRDRWAGFLALLIALGLAVFAVRRWRDTARELIRREEMERALAHELETRRTIEENLRQAEHELRGMFENSIEGIFRSTPEGRYIAANPAMAQIYGYDSPEELLSSISDIAHQVYVDPQRREDFLRELGETGEVRGFENRNYRRDGSIFWVRANARAVRDAKGNIVYYEGNLQDITESKETEDAYRQLVTESVQGIAVLQNNRMVFANPRVAETLGFSVGELLAMGREELGELIHPDDRELLLNRLKDRLSGKAVPSRTISQVRRKDGQARWIELTASKIDYRGRAAALVSLIDVTERKRAQDQLQENALRAQSRDELTAALARVGGDAQAVFDTLARIVGSLIGRTCTVTLLQDEQWLQSVALYSEDAREANRLRPFLLTLRLPLRGHPFASVIERGEPQLFDALEPDALRAFLPADFGARLPAFEQRAYLVVPLRVPNKVIGTLTLSRPLAEGTYAPRDLAFVQELADRAGYAIHNAQLMQQMSSALSAQKANPASPASVRDQEAARLRALVENADELMCLYSKDGTILYVSPSSSRLLGYVPEEMIGKSLLEFVHMRDAAALQDKLAEILGAPGKVLPALPGYVRQKSSGWRLMDGTVQNRLNDSEVQAIVLNLRDVTEQAERERARSDAQAAELTQRTFAQALQDTASILNSTLDYEQVLDRILDQVGRVVPHETATIFLLEGDAFRIARARGFERFDLEAWVLDYRMRAADLQLNTRFARGLPYIINDTHTSPEWEDVPETRWIRSNLSAPIKSKDKLVGMLNLDSTEPGYFTEDHAARLTSFAHHAGIALENARLHVESERRAREMAALYETTRDLATFLDLPDLLGTIVERSMKLLDAPRGGLYTWDANARELELVVERNLTFKLEMRMKAGEGLVGRVAELRQPLVVANYEQWEGRSPQVDGRGLTAMMGAPMLFGGDLIGVLVLVETNPHRQFKEDEVNVLTLFAAHAASAVHSAQLLHQSQERSRQLALLYDAGVTLNRALDLRTQLAFLFQLAIRGLGADHVIFFRYEPQTDTLRFETGTGYDAAMEKELREVTYSVAREEGLLGWVAAQQVPWRIGEPAQEPRWTPLDPDMRSALCAPVAHEGSLRGVLIAVSARVNAFSLHDERLLVLFANQVAAAIETAHLWEEEQRRAAELEILREAGLAFAACEDRDTLVAGILDYALRLVAGDNAIIYHYDQERDQLVLGAMLWAKDRPMLPKHWEPRAGGLTHTVARTGQRIAVSDVNADPLFANWRWGGAIVGLPIRSGETVHAVLNLAYEAPHAFDSNELRALDALTEQAAVALDNVHHLEETKRRLEEARLLHASGEELTRTLSVEQTLPRVADFFVLALGVDSCTICLWQPGEEFLTVAYDQDPIPELHVLPGTHYAARGFPFLDALDRERRTFTFRRDDPELDLETIRVMKDFRFQSFVVLPLILQGNLYGLVELGDRRAPRSYTTDEIRLAESLAHQTASAILNAQLYHQARQRAAHFHLVHRITQLVNEPLPPETVLANVLGELAQTLNVERGGIAVLTRDSSQLTLLASYQPPGEASAVGWVLPLKDNPAHEYLRREHKPLAIADAHNDPRLGHLRLVSRETDTQSLLLVPLVARGEMIGMMGIGSVHHARVFQEDEIALAETVAFYIGLLIERGVPASIG